MELHVPTAVAEIPVSNIEAATAYYRDKLGFSIDWGGEQGGICGISKGHCRLFLTNSAFREPHGNSAPVVVWLNLGNREDVSALHQLWSGKGATILSPPESKPWNLYEFTAADRDGNLLRVFYDFARESGEAK